MGSDVSVVLHSEAAVPEVVLSTQQRALPSRPAVERCPAIRVLEAEAARKLAGDSSAASMASTADLHPLDQPVLLIRNCAELDAFTKSRTYVPVLRAIHACLDQQKGLASLEGKGATGSSIANSSAIPVEGRPVCPIGLIFDPSLALGGRLTSDEARAACAQYLKLFFAHLIAALEFVREPDDAAHTKRPSSPGLPPQREVSISTTAGPQPPRLAILYLDMRDCAMDDAATRWFATGVILRAVRRARPFTLVSARGGAASGRGSGSDGGTFLSYYSPDVKADIVWISLQYVLLTNNANLTEGGARAVLEELLAEDATRDVLLRQQGIDPKTQRALAVQNALMCDWLTPNPDTQLLPQLYLVDLPQRRRGNNNNNAETQTPPPQTSSATRQRQRRDSSNTASRVSGAAESVTSASAAVMPSIPPSPQFYPPQPTARPTSPTPIPAPPASAAAKSSATPNEAGRTRCQLEPDHNSYRVPPPPAATPRRLQQQQQHHQQSAAATLNNMRVPRKALQDAVANLPPQQQLQKQQTRPDVPLSAAALSTKKNALAGSEDASQTALPSPTHLPTPLASGPAPSHSPNPGILSPPCSTTPHPTADAMADNLTKSLQRPTTPPATPPQAVGATPVPGTRKASPPPSTTSPVCPSPKASKTPAAMLPAKASAAEPRSTGAGAHYSSPPPPSLQRAAAGPKGAARQQQQQLQRYPQWLVEESYDFTRPIAGRDTPVPPDDLDALPSPVIALAGSSVGAASTPPLQEQQVQDPLGTPRSTPTVSASRKLQTKQPLTAAMSSATREKRKEHKEEVGEERQQLSSTASGRSPTAATPPTLSRSNRSGTPKTPALKLQQQQQYRDPSPVNTRRVKAAIANAAALDDVPDAVIKGHSTRKPRDQSPRPDVRFYTPSAPVSARKAFAEGAGSVPAPKRHRYFHSPVRPDSLELDKVQAMVDELRASSRALSPSHMSRGRLSSATAAPPLIVSPRGRHPPELDRDVEEVREAEEQLAADEVDLQQQPHHRQQNTGSAQPRHGAGAVPRATGEDGEEEPWLDHAHPIEHNSQHESAAPAAAAAARRGDFSRLGTTTATTNRRSARRRTFDIEALDPPEAAYATAASHIPATMWEEGQRKRHKSPAQVMAARRRARSANLALAADASSQTRGSGTAGPGARFDDVPPRTDCQRHRDSVAAAKAAYEAATLAEEHAKARLELLAQQRASGTLKTRHTGCLSTPVTTAARRHQPPGTATERGASLRVEGEVYSIHDVPLPAASNEVDRRGESPPSPAPNRPSDTRALHSATAAPRSAYATRRLSTAAPPHIDPRFTITSELRKVTSQRCRQVSEVEEGIRNYYANCATPRRDFRGEAAMASMTLRQPTRGELAAVQMAQYVESDRRQSPGNINRHHSRDEKRRPSLIAGSPYEDVSRSYDVSNPAMQAPPRGQGTVSLPQQQQQQQQRRWTPAYRHTGRDDKSRKYVDDDDDVATSSVPSVSPWGTADYQGSAPRFENRAEGTFPGGVAGGGAAGEVSEYGVQLVHSALRTKRGTRY
jgi:hypothetical protein